MPGAGGNGRGVGAGVEEDRVGGGLLVPAAGDLGGASNFSWRKDPNGGVNDGLALAIFGVGTQDMADVEEKIALCGAGVGEAIKGGTSGSGDVNIHGKACESDVIKAGRGSLPGRG